VAVLLSMATKVAVNFTQLASQPRTPELSLTCNQRSLVLPQRSPQATDGCYLA
jgi:hypothetical protein